MREMPTWNADLSALRLGIYTRASDDSDETETSVDAQQGVGESWAESVGITQIERYCDNDKSASWYATKRRDDFDRLVADITAGKLDLVWFWKLNRSQRRLDVFADLRDLCRKHGVNWVIKRRMFDLNSPEDLRVLGNDAVNGEVFSMELSENVKLGLALRASKGKPGGGTTYGYMRTYNHKGKCVGQEPDEALREAISEDGSPCWWSPAGVVREIIRRIANGDVLLQICRDLTRRNIPTPRNGKKAGWTPGVIRRIALNRAYIGMKVHNNEVVILREPAWTPLLQTSDGAPDEETFYVARSHLMGSALTGRSRPTHSVHQLTNLIQCDVCGSNLAGLREKEYKWRPENERNIYRDPNCHVAIERDPLDAFVGRVIAGYLARPDVYADLMGSTIPDSTQMTLRGEIKRLESELEDYRRLAERGEIGAVSFARAEKGIETKIAEDQGKLEKLAAPSLLVGRIGPNAAETWNEVDFHVKRKIIRLAVDIRIKPVGKGHRNVAVADRLVWRWKIGPDSNQSEPVTFPKIDPDAATFAEAREVFAEQLAAGKLPGVHGIRDALHVGQRRAQVIQRHLQVVAPDAQRALSRRA